MYTHICIYIYIQTHTVRHEERSDPKCCNVLKDDEIHTF